MSDDMKDDVLDEVQEAAEEALENPAAEGDDTAPPQSVHDAMFGDLDKEAEVKEAEVKEDLPEAAETEETEAAENRPNPEAAHEDDVHEMPDGLSDKAQKRFQHLANENKAFREKEQEWREVSESVNEFRNLMQESCNNSDEVLQLFDYARAVKTGNWAAAEKHLREQVLQFEMLSGKRLDVDALGEDLRSRIDNMELDEAAARELAQARFRQKKQQEALRVRQEQQQEQQQYAQVRQAAMDEVNQMAAAWAKTDLRWAEREAAMVEFIRAELVHRHPSEWVQGLRWYYDALRRAPQPQHKTTPLLRPGNPQTARKVPQNTMDAMFGDLELG